MRKLLNTLYISTENSYLCKEGETVVIKIGQEVKHQFPLHLFEGIVCFGNVMCSPVLMNACALKNIQISFLSMNGRFLAKVQGPVAGNVLLRREQYRQADQPQDSRKTARSIILGKITNSRTVLLRAAREINDPDKCLDLKNAADRLSNSIKSLNNIDDLDYLRGVEGDAAKIYFSVFDHMVLSNKSAFYFTERSRRPPLDNINALLSFIYTLLVHDVTAAIETVGLDPYVGFLHRDRPGRPSLALDLMEEFRSFVADRLVLSLINRNQIKPEGFKQSETGDVRMDDETRKEVLSAYQKRKQDEIYHPFIQEKVSFGLLPYVQAMLMARFLRGDLDVYVPFIWK